MIAQTHTLSSRLRCARPSASLALLAACALAPPARAQAHSTFSIDPPSVSAGQPDCGGVLNVRAADLLEVDHLTRQPQLGIPQPVCIAARGGGGVGSLGLTMALVANVDALSYGGDAPLGPNVPAGSVWFSVSRSSFGLAFASAKPSVFTEGASLEQAGDVFLSASALALPTMWSAGLGAHVGAIDGDGYANASGCTAPGLGLVEPESTLVGIEGDDLDALDVDQPRSFVLFSLDGAHADACAGITGAGSGPALGFLPADVLASNLSGNPPTVWASAAALGLDRGGAGTDDLDALAVWDNGNRSFDEAEQLFQWLNGSADMVLFSVRADSAVVGQPDSLTGSPIEPGDVLMPPLPGGLSAFPGILIPAEALGLATNRAGSAMVCSGAPVADELDGLDLTDEVQFDCDGNGQEDALEILFGAGLDLDENGVLDVCEPGGGGGNFYILSHPTDERQG